MRKRGWKGLEYEQDDHTQEKAQRPKDSEKVLVLKCRGEEGLGSRAGKEGTRVSSRQPMDSDLQELNEASSPAKGTTKELERFANMSGSTRLTSRHRRSGPPER